MTKKAPETARDEPPLMRRAADLKWANARRAWGDIAAEIGVDPKTLYRWRQTEEWEITFRAAGAQYIETLAPAAINGLLAAWEKGNPAGALEVLRSFGLMSNERIEIDRPVTIEEIAALRDRLADPAH